jgi:hypothetical protein
MQPLDNRVLGTLTRMPQQLYDGALRDAAISAFSKGDAVQHIIQAW